MSAADASNVDLVRGALEALNRRDVSQVRALCTPETTATFPDQTCRGGDEMAAYFERAFVAIPDRHVEILKIVGDGDDVIVRFHLTATHAGNLGGLHATGKALALDGFEHFVLRDGKVVSSFVVTDQLQLARQVGLVPPDGSRPDRAMKAAFGLRTRIARRLNVRVGGSGLRR